MVAVALLASGTSIFAANAASRIPSVWAPAASLAALWVGLLTAVAYSSMRARPAGLLRFRWIDILWGVAAGLAFRAVQGWGSAANAMPFPAAPDGARMLELQWWMTEILPAALIGPVIEEFFFRAVILVAMYQMFRRSLGYGAASATAILASAGGFVLLHTLLAPLNLSDALQLFILGAGTAVIVLLTGRIWAAVIAHIVYNVTFLGLMIVGTALS